jgi:hypothetical protein
VAPGGFAIPTIVGPAGGGAGVVPTIVAPAAPSRCTGKTPLHFGQRTFSPAGGIRVSSTSYSDRQVGQATRILDPVGTPGALAPWGPAC